MTIAHQVALTHISTMACVMYHVAMMPAKMMEMIVSVLVKLPCSAITPVRKNVTFGTVTMMEAIVQNAHQVALIPISAMACVM